MSSFWIKLCSLIAAVSSTQLYAVNNSDAIWASQYLHILSFDTTTTAFHSYPTTVPSSYLVETEGVICHGIYYTYWADTRYSKIFLTFDVTTHETQSFNFQDTAYEDSYLSFGCTSTSDQLVAVEWYDNGTHDDHRVMDLSYIRFTDNKVEKTFIGFLPDPATYFYAVNFRIFSFTSDFSELWISLQHDAANGSPQGLIAVIDPKTAKWTETYWYPQDAGLPFFSLPQTLSDGTFEAALLPRLASEKLDFVRVQINETTKMLSVTVEVEDAKYLLGSGQLMQPICNDTGYIIDGENVINAFDARSGKEIAEYDFKEYANFQAIYLGSLACV